MRWPFFRSPLSSTPTPEPVLADGQSVKTTKESKYARWGFKRGASVGEGRSVLKRLGGGSAYEVFLVWDENLFALMVAKLLRPDRVGDERSMRELRREVALLEKLAHPTLVRGFGASLDGDYPHVLLEPVEGPNLSRLIKRDGALPLSQLLPVALNVAAVLHYLSVKQVVHLDVKPGNIVMGIPPRLIDLSIARSFEDAAGLKAVIGTDPYMPPEQCDPQSFPGMIGPAADIFGLGATLYHAAAGRVPYPRIKGFDSHDAHARFPQIRDEPEPLPKSLPQSLKELILGTLEKDPARRPTARDVAASLESLVAETTSVRRRKGRKVDEQQQELDENEQQVEQEQEVEQKDRRGLIAPHEPPQRSFFH